MDPHSFCSWWVFQSESLFLSVCVCCIFTYMSCVVGVLNITVSAEAEASQTVCDNEIVSVPERGRIDTVTRSLLVQVSTHQTALRRHLSMILMLLLSVRCVDVIVFCCRLKELKRQRPTAGYCVQRVCLQIFSIFWCIRTDNAGILLLVFGF